MDVFIVDLAKADGKIGRVKIPGTGPVIGLDAVADLSDGVGPIKKRLPDRSVWVH